MTLPETQVVAPTYLQISACRLCGSSKWTNILSLGEQFLIDFVKERNPLLPKCPLDLIRCDECGLTQLKHSADPDLLWREFWYRSSVNHTMRVALDSVVERALGYVREGSWLDIGANDGFLLSRVPKDFERFGCEPALNMIPELQKHATPIPTYFSAEAVGGRKFSVITSVAMFYDLDDPNAFVKDVATCLEDHGVWINQLSYTPTMLKANAFDNIVHEHRCYYDLATLERLYQAHGFRAVKTEFNDVNGGSVRITAKHAKHSGRLMRPIERAGVPLEDLMAFAERIKRWKQTVQEILKVCGSLWCYGASTKGSTLLQYLGLDDYRIQGIADRNPLKYGTTMPGVWAPILSEEEMRKQPPHVLLVLPWAFRAEFVKREEQLRKNGTRMLFPLPNPEFVI